MLHPERGVVATIAWGCFMAERIPEAEFRALDSDVNLICVSDVIDEVAQQIAAFIDTGFVCPGWESNPHIAEATEGFKSRHGGDGAWS